MYTFKNEASGELLTVTAKGIALEKADKDKEQKLNLIMSDNGTFALKAADGGYVSAKLKGFDYPKGRHRGSAVQSRGAGQEQIPHHYRSEQLCKKFSPAENGRADCCGLRSGQSYAGLDTQ